MEQEDDSDVLTAGQRSEVRDAFEGLGELRFADCRWCEQKDPETAGGSRVAVPWVGTGVDRDLEVVSGQVVLWKSVSELVWRMLLWGRTTKSQAGL